MLEDIFGKYPQVKVVDFILTHPFEQYTKQQLAVGSEISRSTLNKFIDKLVDVGIIVKTNKKYEINKHSKVARLLDDTQNELAHETFNHENEEESIKYSDEEIDDIFNNISDEDLNLNLIEKEINKNEMIMVNKKEYEKLKDLVSTSKRNKINLNKAHNSYSITFNKKFKNM